MFSTEMNLESLIAYEADLRAAEQPPHHDRPGAPLRGDRQRRRDRPHHGLCLPQIRQGVRTALPGRVLPRPPRRRIARRSQLPLLHAQDQRRGRHRDLARHDPAEVRHDRLRRSAT
ncbi:MAG: hypothetical protein MZW92_12460 [Comamonadaceae bacterium]|nr:hypothetical protein [Comamonadaceae bacterium]